MDWIESIEARRRSQAKYDKTHTVGVYLKLNWETDRDIIDWLRLQSNKQGMIKQLIRESMRNS